MSPVALVALAGIVAVVAIVAYCSLRAFGDDDDVGLPNDEEVDRRR